MCNDKNCWKHRFEITNSKLYFPIVTLSTKDNGKLTIQLKEGFKRLVYRSGYKTKMQSQNVANNNSPTKIYLDVYFHGVRRLFVPVFDNTDHGDKKVEKNSHRKYFLPRVNITNYNVLIDAESFMINPFKINFKNMMKLENLQ